MVRLRAGCPECRALRARSQRVMRHSPCALCPPQPALGLRAAPSCSWGQPACAPPGFLWAHVHKRRVSGVGNGGTTPSPPIRRLQIAPTRYSLNNNLTWTPSSAAQAFPACGVSMQGACCRGSSRSPHSCSSRRFRIKRRIAVLVAAHSNQHQRAVPEVTNASHPGWAVLGASVAAGLQLAVVSAADAYGIFQEARWGEDWARFAVEWPLAAALACMRASPPASHGPRCATMHSPLVPEPTRTHPCTCSVRAVSPRPLIPSSWCWTGSAWRRC